MSPLVGPLASSTETRDPHSGAGIWHVAPMTVYALPFFFLISPASCSPACQLSEAARLIRRCGGGL